VLGRITGNYHTRRPDTAFLFADPQAYDR